VFFTTMEQSSTAPGIGPTAQVKRVETIEGFVQIWRHGRKSPALIFGTNAPVVQGTYLYACVEAFRCFFFTTCD
jgi:hypothetical protein